MEGLSVDLLTEALTEELLPELIALDRIIFDAIGDRYGDHVWREEHFQKRLEQKWQLSCLARTQGRLVGFWIASRRSPTTVHTHRVATHPEQQGQGVGKAMFELARKQAAQVGAGQMTLFVVLANRTAIAFYERVGFSQLKGDPLSEFIGDRPHAAIENNLVLMEGIHYRAMHRAL